MIVRELESTLARLLENGRKMRYADECCYEIQSGNLVIKGMGDPVPIDNIRGIYSVRAKFVKRDGFPIYGLDTLLENLANSDHSLVVIYLIKAGEYSYLIFTDEMIVTLFGIVAIDETTDWRSNSLRPEL